MLERVQKIIAESGFCSRRAAEEFIINKKVTVNGKLITIGDKADKQKDLIMVGKKKITIQEHVYIMLNKPSDYLCTRDDPYDRRTVMSLVRDIPRNIYPVGRLDRYARGLILLTSDGDFSQKVLHPKHKITKTYQVSLDRTLTKEHAQRIRAGLIIESRKVKAKLTILKPKLVNITIAEGRNKIVKKIFNKLEYYVKDLKRVAIGSLKLTIKEGTYKKLTQKEMEKIFISSFSSKRPARSSSPRARSSSKKTSSIRPKK